MDLFSCSNDSQKVKSGASAQIKRWFREQLSLQEDATITVSELRCGDENCPDVETVVGVLLGPGCQRKWRILAPVASVTSEEIAAKLAEFPFDPQPKTPVL